jgi:hypothetical protein
MPRLIMLVLGFITAILCGSLFAATDSQLAMQSLNQMPLAFTKNMGQWDSEVLFRASAGGATMWFTKEGVTYQFTRRVASPVGAALAAARDSVSNAAATGDREGRPYAMEGLDSRLRGNDKEGANDMERDSVERLVLTAKFVGANANPEVVAEGQMEYKCNYFIGNNPSKWHTDVPNYEAIVLKDIYTGIDLRCSGDGNGQAVYEYVVAPGADIAQIKVEYEGAEETSIDADGRMVVRTKWGNMIGAIGLPVNGAGSISHRLSLNSENAYGSQADNQNPNQSKSLALQLYYSTYLGGTHSDCGNGIAVDEDGNAYVTGQTMSSNFPTKDAYDSTDNASLDAFVTKFSSCGALIYSTYLGGDGLDGGSAIAEFGRGRVFVTGSTNSTDFPTQNPYQTYQGSVDAFVAKLSRTGDSLIYSTYLGGTGSEYGTGIAIDADNAYVTGQTFSSDFPTLNPFQTNQGGIDAFVTKLSSSGNSLIYSTYLGGGDHDYGYGIVVNMLDHAYVTGMTISSDFPTENPFQTTLQGYSDAFVTELSSSGATLDYSTYLGGGNSDYGRSIALAGSYAIVTGETLSSNFPTKNPYQTDQGVADAFVTKLSYYGDSLIYSTYLGGGGSDYGYGIAVGAGDIAYVTGATNSLDFPTLNPYQTYQSNSSYYKDVFVTSLSGSGDGLMYSTYLGGGLHDYGYGIAVDGDGNAYVAGSTQSSDFPTMNPYQPTYQGGENGVFGGDAFVTKLNYGLGDMVFRPDPDGWQFVNAGGNMWPESWWQQFDYRKPQYPLSWRFMCSPSDFPDWHLWVRTFGVDQCYYSFQPGTLIYKPSAVSRWLDEKQDWHGSCVGFAISSLLFFDGFLDVATEFPGNTEVYQVPIGDESRLMVNMYWTYIFGEARRAYVNANWHITTPLQTLQACQEMFQSTARDDRALYMANNNGHGGHVVVPYRCAVDPLDPNVTYIYIYDNNSPGDESRRVAINTLTDTWSYDAKPTWGGAKQLFLLDPISNYTVTPIMSRLPAPPSESGDRTERSLSQYAEFYLPSTGDVIFRFGSDSIGCVDGMPLSTLTDGIPIIPITGQETPSIGYYLPNHTWNIQLSGFSDSTLRLTAYLDSTVIAYSRNGVDSTQIDKLNYSGNDSSIVVVNPDIVSHVYNLQVISIRPDSEVVVKIGGITSEAGDSNHFSITSESGLRIDNYGAASAYSIRVEIAGPTVDTVFFHDSVTIGGNSSHVIVPDWRLNHDSLLVLVDSGMTGYFSDTLVVSNQREILFACGDVDGEGTINIADAVYLISYIFSHGPAPSPLAAGDTDCSGDINIADAVYLINYIFSHGPQPCEACK